MNLKITNKLFIIIFTGICILLAGCNSKETLQSTRALFSWKSSAVLEDHTQLFDTMAKMKLNTLYQQFSNELKEEEVRDFFTEATKEKIDVYLLVGSPEWALETYGESMRSQVDKALKINQVIGKNPGLKGILFDVEPYLLKDWDKQGAQIIMDNFVQNMKIAYQNAQKNGLEVIICIPYFYDNLGVSKQLEELIKSCCNSIAIMNYYKGREYENIKNEVNIAAKYGKQVINIYEMQAPGKNDLIDKNTYYKDGINAAEENFAALRAAFNGKNISIAFHEYEALKVVSGRE